MARIVPLKLNYAPREGLVRGPQYTIQEDPPWLLSSPSPSFAKRASSMYSVDMNNMADDAAPPPPPIKLKPSYHAATFPVQRPEVQDFGAQTRTSRMPIFKQVRSMLSNTKQSPANGSSSPSSIKWDEYSGEPSETGKEANVKPSTYKSPYEGILHSRKRSPEKSQISRPRAQSPVSALMDTDYRMLDSASGQISPPSSRPVSPIGQMDFGMPPMQAHPNILARPRTEGSTTAQVRRKPVGNTTSNIENIPPMPDFRMPPNSSHGHTSTSDDPASRFSWTTAAASEAPRPSIDTRQSPQIKSSATFDAKLHNSHFSWSTVATANPRDQTPPPSPPPVPAHFLQPPTYGTPPTQSILSRQRPCKRVDNSEWAPSRASPSPTPGSVTPRTYRVEEPIVTTTPSNEGKKALPLPPLYSEKSLSHLEALLSQEKNLVMQRRNIERSIWDLEKIEKASPLDVSFSAVREARKKLEERRCVLDEVRKEEMDVGIRIARARRKEDFGDGEGTLWVRRVTG